MTVMGREDAGEGRLNVMGKEKVEEGRKKKRKAECCGYRGRDREEQGKEKLIKVVRKR